MSRWEQFPSRGRGRDPGLRDGRWRKAAVTAAKDKADALSRALGGLGVVVTRPIGQAERLCALIEEAGGATIRFPAIEIGDPEDGSALASAIEALDEFDLAVFISANAVARTLPRVWASRGWPASLKVAAIGQATARELDRHGLRADVSPRERFDSEALLDLPEMKAVVGKRVVIFRGDGGRELLGQTLRDRGAVVDYVETYRRVQPRAGADRLMRLWAEGSVDIFTVTSSQALRNLFELVGPQGRRRLLETPLVVIGARTVDLAARLGFKQSVLMADEASDAGVVRKLIEWRESATAAGSATDE